MCLCQLQEWDSTNDRDRRALMVAFTTVIHAIGHDGDVRSCLQLFERAREEGMTPDLTMYSTLVNVLLTNDEVDAAQKLHASCGHGPRTGCTQH